MKSPWFASSATKSTSIITMPQVMRSTDCSCFSIRLIFSIADLQTEQEPEFEEGQEGAEGAAEDPEAPLHNYPLRCSFSFTKVCHFCSLYPLVH